MGSPGTATALREEFGIAYRQVDLTPENTPDLPGIVQAVQEPNVKAVLIQRSRGYATRASLSVETIRDHLPGHSARPIPTCWILVDNCYGEFVETVSAQPGWGRTSLCGPRLRTLAVA